jgi:hypothetical protein
MLSSLRFHYRRHRGVREAARGLPAPTASERALIEELRAGCRALPVEPTAGRTPNAADWATAMNRLRSLVLRADPRAFLRWDVVVERMRSASKPMLASALEHAAPVAVTASGTVTIELDEPNDIYAHAITTARPEIAEVLREWFGAVQRVELRRSDTAPSAPPKRLTDEMVRSERVASLRKRDPVLGAAIDALDLDLTD